MTGSFTNRDLYLAALAFEERAEGIDRTLETWLLALWGLARPLREQPSIGVDAFLRLLEEALSAPAPAFRDTWRGLPDELGVNEPPGPGKWEATIIRQIRDLREMDEAGMSPGPGMYLLTAPRGSPWYHFDPGSYVVAGIAYHFGGWEREGEGEEVRAEDMRPVDEITWHDFTEFLLEAQWNE
jgi:hypothetical protein